MLEYKQSVQAFVPVRLLDSTGAPITGKIYTDVSAAIMKSDGTEISLTLSAPDWVELSTGAWSGNGAYRLRLSTSNLDTTGMLMYTVRCTGASDYDGIVKVVANEEADTYIRIGAPVGASISADLALKAVAATALSTAQWTNTRAANLDNLDATISSRSTFAGGAVSSVTGNVGGNVVGSVGSVVGLTASNLDVAVSSRAPSATALSTAEWTNTRAGYLDLLNTYLDATISSRSTFAGGAVASVTGNVGGNVVGSVGSVVGLTVANLDVAVSTLATASALSQVMSKVTRNQLFREGRSKIHTSGPDANRQVQYASDGTTVLQKWDLKDSSGSATTTSIFERIPVNAIP